MKLITQELLKRFKEVGDQSEVIDPLVIAKFFDPTGSASWYATEYDPDTNCCFGYVAGLVAEPQGGFDEWGSFSISELELVQLPFGLAIERDIYFKEMSFQQLMKKQRLTELAQNESQRDKTEELER